MRQFAIVMVLALLAPNYVWGTNQAQVIDTCDIVEDNTVVKRGGKFRQLIFWEWDSEERAYIAVQWAPVYEKSPIFHTKKGFRKRIAYRFNIDNYVQVEEMNYRFSYFKSETDWDPEIENRQKFPQNRLRRW